MVHDLPRERSEEVEERADPGISFQTSPFGSTPGSLAPRLQEQRSPPPSQPI